MIALIIDTCGQITPLKLSSSNTEDAIREVINAHHQVLNQCGLTTEWLNDYAYDDLDYSQSPEPQWIENIRIHTWWACYSHYESDDEIVELYMAEIEKSNTTHTGIFFGSNKDSLIFTFDEVCESDLSQSAYEKISEGLVGLVTDTQKAFPSAWVERHRGTMPNVEHLMKGMSVYHWIGDGKHEEFNHLWLYVIDNRMSSKPLGSDGYSI